MKKIIAHIFLLVVLLSSTAIAQVTIAPTNLFINNQTKFGTYMVINGSNQPQEISIEFIFGYSDTDENGNRFLVYDDSVAAEKHSITDWTRAFPRNFTLQPGDRQIVRLRVSAPNDIEDGTYWARIKTSSLPESAPVEVESSETVSASIGFKIEQITGVYLKKGNVTTGIDIQTLNTQLNEENNILSVLADIARTGNSPFLGTIQVDIFDANNKRVLTPAVVATTIFFDGKHKQDIDVSSLKAGTYTAEISFRTERSDISGADIVQAQTVSKKTSFDIK
jgi:hypothetical protein